MKTWFTTMNFYYRKTIRLLKREMTLKGCHLQNNFQEIWFFYINKPIILLEAMIGCRMFLKNSIWICSFTDCNFTKIALRQGCFPVNFLKIFKNSFSIEYLWKAASKTNWLPVQKIIWRSFYMIYDKQWNLHLYLFR